MKCFVGKCTLLPFLDMIKSPTSKYIHNNMLANMRRDQPFALSTISMCVSWEILCGVLQFEKNVRKMIIFLYWSKGCCFITEMYRMDRMWLRIISDVMSSRSIFEFLHQSTYTYRSTLYRHKGERRDVYLTEQNLKTMNNNIVCCSYYTRKQE